MRKSDGFLHYPGLFTVLEQYALLGEALAVARNAPFMWPTPMEDGGPWQVETTSAGQLGWCPGSQGYGYRDTHPHTGRPWPPLGPMMRAAVDRLRAMAGGAMPMRFHPDSCLISRYRCRERLVLPQNDDGEAPEAPLLLISLGDTARFLVSTSARGEPQREVLLGSGDGLVLAGQARRYRYGLAGPLAGGAGSVSGEGWISLGIHQARQRDGDGLPAHVSAPSVFQRPGSAEQITLGVVHPNLP